MKPADFARKAVNKLARQAAALWRKFSHPATLRPTVLIQSDDWGRSGMPDPAAIGRLGQAGISFTGNPWELFGLESADDLQALGELLLSKTDADGRNAVMSAVFVLANADLQGMQAEGYAAFRAVPIADGFPPPWQQAGLLGDYQQLVKAGAFYPALHGYTHFNPALMLALAREESPRGMRIRALHAEGIPYLATLTPEFNFALLDRSQAPACFIPGREQAAWISAGINLFCQAFGQAPYSTCAPGYRFNSTTCNLWQQEGIKVVHCTHGQIREEDGCWLLPRNVFFEPVLENDAFTVALAAAERAISRGEPVVICTHSINFVSRHNHRAGHGLAELSRLLDALTARFPGLRFANEEDLHKSWIRRDPEWWRRPAASEIHMRCRVD